MKFTLLALIALMVFPLFALPPMTGQPPHRDWSTR